MIPAPRIRHWDLYDYEPCAEAMRQQTETRDENSADEIWLLQHPSVLTLGVGADPSHIHPQCPLPVIRSSRGGQVTCHMPGQLVVYTLLDLRRMHLGVRALVERLESAVLALLEEARTPARRKNGMPGVYVEGKKIMSIGLRISRAQSSHGLALNVHPDLSLFRQIDICGNPKLEATSLQECGVDWSVDETARKFLPHLLHTLYPGEVCA